MVSHKYISVKPVPELVSPICPWFFITSNFWCKSDPVPCINTLTLFYLYGRGNQLKETFEWVKNILIRRAYLGGTYYYLTADCFLYFFSRFLLNVPEVYNSLKKILRQAISERFGAPGDALALAMRIIAANNVDMVDLVDVPALLSLQQEDGRFTGYFYRYPSTGILIGNDGAATALAIQAIKLLQSPQKRTKISNKPPNFS